MKKIFKKSLSVFLALCFVYSFPSFAANAEYSAGDFRLEARDDGVVIVGYQGSEENLTIPSVLHSEKTGEDAPVVEIGECAFGYNNTLETLTFSRNLKTIGDEAFCGCGKLTSITFSEGLQTIGVSAFAGCASLETVELPDSLLTLSAGAFENCDALRYVDTGNGVTTVSAAAFRGCDELKTVVFGRSVEAINKMAFAGCFKISDITAGHSIKTIASDAFDGSLDPTKVKCYFNSAYYDFAKNEGYSAIHTFVFSDITIEISSPTKDQYNVGETFDDSGIKVIASYEDSYDRDVTELAVIEINGTTSKPGEIKVSAAYEENGTEISKIKRIPVVGEAAAYTATFKADGSIVGTVEFTVEDETITEPTVPTKEGYTGAWEAYTLKAENITINAVYTPIEFTATFKADGEVVETVEFTVEDETITEPTVPAKEGYTGAWEAYMLKAENITINAVYTPIEFTATFKADGEVVGTVKFTVETTEITEPAVPP
ncbi:MAG: leucine-rich repeat protein, partial [Clostridiales bacterium]|nr:leucine-rich repeat protein [Clostridiales bacterium]